VAGSEVGEVTERFTVQETIEYGVRIWTGTPMVQDGNDSPFATPHRVVAEEELARRSDGSLISRRVFVMTGEWQPVEPKVGLPEPVERGSLLERFAGQAGDVPSPNHDGPAIHKYDGPEW
jgi:hypothetical protein